MTTIQAVIGNWSDDVAPVTFGGAVVGSVRRADGLHFVTIEGHSDDDVAPAFATFDMASRHAKHVCRQLFGFTASVVWSGRDATEIRVEMQDDTTTIRVVAGESPCALRTLFHGHPAEARAIASVVALAGRAQAERCAS